jgi:hypothetical protein
MSWYGTFRNFSPYSVYGYCRRYWRSIALTGIPGFVGLLWVTIICVAFVISFLVCHLAVIELLALCGDFRP